ncbi:hypothetical protein L1887_25761 [Cichorium endivia]|nr:hypothetical protein L1887_25761 [Cichorium endivia]
MVDGGQEVAGRGQTDLDIRTVGVAMIGNDGEIEAICGASNNPRLVRLVPQIEITNTESACSSSTNSLFIMEFLAQKFEARGN